MAEFGELRPELSRRLRIRVFAKKGMAHAGYAHRDGYSLTLRAAECDALEAGVVNRTMANAVFVLAHECGHDLAHTNDETKANSYAFSHFRLYARRLGLTRLQALKLWRLCPYR